MLLDHEEFTYLKLLGNVTLDIFSLNSFEKLQNSIAFGVFYFIIDKYQKGTKNQ